MFRSLFVLAARKAVKKAAKKVVKKAAKKVVKKVAKKAKAAPKRKVVAKKPKAAPKRKAVKKVVKRKVAKKVVKKAKVVKRKVAKKAKKVVKKAKAVKKARLTRATNVFFATQKGNGLKAKWAAWKKLGAAQKASFAAKAAANRQVAAKKRTYGFAAFVKKNAKKNVSFKAGAGQMKALAQQWKGLSAAAKKQY